MDTITEEQSEQPAPEITASSMEKPDAVVEAPPEENISIEVIVSGFDRGLNPDYIDGVGKNADGEVVYLMHWKESTIEDLIPSHVASVKCPQIVINFLQSIIVWKTAEKGVNGAVKEKIEQ